MAQPDRERAYLCLDDRERAFVDRWVDFGDDDRIGAVKAAGYEGSYAALKQRAYRLMHNPTVQAAIREKATERLNSLDALCVGTLADIARNGKKETDRLKAVNLIMDRIGMHAVSETHVKTEDVSMGRAALEQRLKELLAKNPHFKALIPSGFDIEAQAEPPPEAPALPAPAQEEDDW